MKRDIKNKFYCELGSRIQQMRLLNNLSQAYLGERLGVTQATMRRYESGEVHIPTDGVGKCSKELGASVEYLLFGEDGQQPANSNINRVGLMVAGEIMQLPDENIRKSVFHLVRSINRHEDTKE